ncbi:PREDICTED: uncharacterized protein LOC109129815 [Camelina sativa]|uniref:Uncharacterized protein LOC109129815 n=1 Tax=Camelina sativa TaxID=90675 RepID=A0ABM1R596_CAMSA|nr:PREDICTED: uncharacterized protein LOC109129815 [Camelina sativa]
MADIAILVAEEYERRMRPTTGSNSATPVEFDWKKIIPAKMTVAINKMKIESLKNNFEAKSHDFALAISHGFFSA